MGHTKKIKNKCFRFTVIRSSFILAIEKTCSSKQVFCQHPVSEWNGMGGNGWRKRFVSSLSLSQPHRYLLIFFRKPTIRDSRGKSLSNYKLGTKDSFSFFRKKKKLKWNAETEWSKWDIEITSNFVVFSQ